MKIQLMANVCNNLDFWGEQIVIVSLMQLWRIIKDHLDNVMFRFIDT